METLDQSPETLDVSASAVADAETLDGGGGGGLAAGELVWAKAKGQLWWPALVVCTCPSSPSGSHRKRSLAAVGPDVLVAYFGHGHGHGAGGDAARCRAAQLQGFVAAGADEMARQSRAKGFVAAVEEALDHVGGCLEAELTCRCVPPEACPPAPPEGNLGIVNLAPLEFLNSIRDVALDVSVAGLIECARLKSWVTAFGRGWGKDGAGCYLRHAVEELVDRIDLDVLAGEVAGDDKKGEEENNEEEEGWRLEAPEEKLCGSQKKRSMAALMEELDSGAAESEKAKEAGTGEGENVGLEDEKKSESAGGKTGEESGFVKRERKKSKYLSPPYTNLSGLVLLQKGVDAKIPRKCIDVSQYWAADLPKILSCNGEGIQEEEDENKALSVNFGAASVEEIFSMLRCTARDVFHLKWNRSSKVVKGFVALYRSSMFVEGTDHENYKAHNCEAAKLARKDTTAKSYFGKFEENVETIFGKADSRTSGLVADSSAVSQHGKAGWKRNRKKYGDDSRQMGDQSGSAVKRKKKEKINVGTPLGPGLAFTSVVPIRQVIAEDIRSQEKVGGGANSAGMKVQEKEKIPSASITPSPAIVSEQARTGQERKQANDGSVRETLTNADHNVTDQSAKKNVKGMKKSENSEANIGVVMNMENIIVDVPVRSEPLPMDRKKDDANGEAAERTGKGSYDFLEAAKLEMLQKIEVANGKNVIGMSRGLKDQSQKDKAKQKKKKTIDGANAADFSGKTINGTHPNVANLAQKKKKKTAQHFGNPAALLLDFTQGVILPSKEELLSIFGKFGFLIKSETEIVKDTRSARVVFAKSAEAEAAYNSAETLGTFGPPFATLRLHYLPPIKLRSPPSPSPASKPPLTDIRKNLEKMISSLTGPSSFKKAASPDGPVPGADNLVGEMQGLLAKVDKMLSGPSTSTPP